MVNDPKLIAARLAEIAKERSISQKAISEKSGIFKRLAIIIWAFILFCLCLLLIIPSLLVVGNKTADILEMVWAPIFEFFED